MTALARRTDPQSSHDAAQASKVNHRPHKAIIAGLLKAAPGSTYQELFRRHAKQRQRYGNAPVIPDAPSLMRRLPEIARRTGERKCKVTGRTASTWELRA